MQPSLIILASWILFGGSHLVLSGSSLRTMIVIRYGARGFTILFSVVTLVTMLGLIWASATYGDKGRAGFGLATHTTTRWLLGGLSGAGAFLAIAGLINYPRSPMAILAQRQRELGRQQGFKLNAPSAIERVVRHPFFVGLAIMMSAHALLASTLASAVYFLGFVVVAIIGIPMQDRKLRARWEKTYMEFEAQTSNIPFSAKTSAKEKPEWGRWALAGLITTLLFGALHFVWKSANGAPFAALILVFGLLGVAKGLAASSSETQS